MSDVSQDDVDIISNALAANETSKGLSGDTQSIDDVQSGNDESEDVIELSEESIDEHEMTESDEDQEETDLDAIAEGDDLTWNDALGIAEEQIAFDDDGNVIGFNVKINGKADTVSAADLIKDYQSSKSTTEKSRALAEERKTFETSKQYVEQQYVEKLNNADVLVDYLSQKLVGQFEGVQWDQLRVENPAEYAAMKQDYAAQAQELKQAQEAIKAERAQQAKSQQEANYSKHMEYMQHQYDILIANNPGWADKNVYAEQFQQFEKFASDQYGFTPDEFKNVYDARLIALLQDAKAFREGAQIAEKKRTKPVPKFRKSGVKPIDTKNQKAKKRFKATGSVNDLAAFLDSK